MTSSDKFSKGAIYQSFSKRNPQPVTSSCMVTEWWPGPYYAMHLYVPACISPYMHCTSLYVCMCIAIINI